MPRLPIEEALTRVIEDAGKSVKDAMTRLEAARGRARTATEAVQQAAVDHDRAVKRQARAKAALAALAGELPDLTSPEEATDDATTIMSDAVEAATVTTPREKQRALRHIAATLAADESPKDGSSD